MFPRSLSEQNIQIVKINTYKRKFKSIKFYVFHGVKMV